MMEVFLFIGFKLVNQAYGGLDEIKTVKCVAQLKFQTAFLNTSCVRDFKGVCFLILQACCNKTLAFAMPRIR